MFKVITFIFIVGIQSLGAMAPGSDVKVLPTESKDGFVLVKPRESKLYNALIAVIFREIAKHFTPEITEFFDAEKLKIKDRPNRYTEYWRSCEARKNDFLASCEALSIIILEESNVVDGAMHRAVLASVKKRFTLWFCREAAKFYVTTFLIFLNPIDCSEQACDEMIDGMRRSGVLTLED